MTKLSHTKNPPLESNYQKSVKERIIREFPGARVAKAEPSRFWQGVPDLLITYKGIITWFECKRETNAAKRRNQEWWVRKLNEETFACFCYPEVKEEAFCKLHEFYDTHQIKENA